MANGVPSLLVAAEEAAIVFLTADAIASQIFAAPQWGIFQNGAAIIVPDSIVGVTIRRDWKLPDYPVQDGAFETYNKVAAPIDARVIMTKGGTAAERQAFILTLDSLAASLELVDVVMPDCAYTNHNIAHYSFQRTEKAGVTLITAEVWLQQIRNGVTTSFTNTAEGASQDSQNGGSAATTTTPQNSTGSTSNTNQSPAATGLSIG